MAESVQTTHKKKLASFEKMMLQLVPAANKIIKEALKLRKPKIGTDGKAIKVKPIPPKSVDLARYVLDQYAKMIMPEDTDVHAVHIVDHAELAKIQQAQTVIAEMNQFRARNNRGLDIGLN